MHFTRPRLRRDEPLDLGEADDAAELRGRRRAPSGRSRRPRTLSTRPSAPARHSCSPIARRTPRRRSRT
jgi:hypothetical protein